MFRWSVLVVWFAIVSGTRDEEANADPENQFGKRILKTNYNGTQVRRDFNINPVPLSPINFLLRPGKLFSGTKEVTGKVQLTDLNFVTPQTLSYNNYILKEQEVPKTKEEHEAHIQREKENDQNFDKQIDLGPSYSSFVNNYASFSHILTPYIEEIIPEKTTKKNEEKLLEAHNILPGINLKINEGGHEEGLGETADEQKVTSEPPVYSGHIFGGGFESFPSIPIEILNSTDDSLHLNVDPGTNKEFSEKQDVHGYYEGQYGQEKLDYDEEYKTVTITKEIPVPVPVPVEKKIPVPYKVPVDKPYPVYISKPVAVPVTKPVPVPVKVPVPKPYPVERVVHVPIRVPFARHFPVPVVRHIPYYVFKKVPYAVVKHIPYPVKIPTPMHPAFQHMQENKLHFSPSPHHMKFGFPFVAPTHNLGKFLPPFSQDQRPQPFTEEPTKQDESIKETAEEEVKDAPVLEETQKEPLQTFIHHQNPSQDHLNLPSFASNEVQHPVVDLSPLYKTVPNRLPERNYHRPIPLLLSPDTDHKASSDVESYRNFLALHLPFIRQHLSPPALHVSFTGHENPSSEQQIENINTYSQTETR